MADKGEARLFSKTEEAKWCCGTHSMALIVPALSLSLGLELPFGVLQGVGSGGLDGREDMDSRLSGTKENDSLSSSPDPNSSASAGT